MKEFKKILLIGSPGSGKSTLAVKLSKLLNLPVFHLDKLYWKDNWTESSNEEFDNKLENVLNKQEWIIDGNYKRTLNKRLLNADLCIFLDFPTEICVSRIKERFEKYKGTTRPDMGDNCPERYNKDFFGYVENFNTNIRQEILDILDKSETPVLQICDPENIEKEIRKFFN